MSWNKGSGTRPQLGRPRAQCEYIVFATNGPHDGGSGEVIDGFFYCPTERDRYHITQKPIALMQELVRLCPLEGVVLDPFCGSASTAVAAIREGRRAITIESNEEIERVARQRLEAESVGLSLSDARTGQTSIFGGST